MRKRRSPTTTRMSGGRAVLALALFGICALGGEKRAPAEPTIVAGTVFREPGFALPNAEVTLRVAKAPEGVKVAKSQTVASNFRGEFSFRVPAARAEYVLSVKAAGLVPEEKAVVVGADPERLEIYLTLKPEAPKGK